MAEEKKDEVIAEYKTRPATDHDYEILKYMIVTEKTQKLAAERNVITLRVEKTANKTDIRTAVQAVFGVKVTKVNTVNVHAKKRGYRRGYAQAYKKAYVYVDRAYDLGKITDAVASEERKSKQD